MRRYFSSLPVSNHCRVLCVFATVSTFAAIWYAFSESILPSALQISGASLLFLFWWDRARPPTGPLKFLPGPLVVVFIGIVGNFLLSRIAPALQLQPTHLVQVPIVRGGGEFLSLIRFPDFNAIGNRAVWTVALTIALVASLESLLSIKAVDELDPKRRTS